MDALIVQNGRVVDAIVVDSLEDYDPGPSRVLIPAGIGGIGWSYVNGELKEPEPDESPEPRQRKVVSAAQGGTALIRAGKMGAVLVAANAADTPPEVKWAFDKATEWSRDSAAFNYLADKAGITEAEKDALFAEASGILP